MTPCPARLRPLLLALLLCLSVPACGDGGSPSVQPDAGGGADGGPAGGGAPGGPINGNGADGGGGGGGGSGGNGGGGNPPVSPVTIPGIEQVGQPIRDVEETFRAVIGAACPGGDQCVNLRVEGGGSAEIPFCLFAHAQTDSGEYLVPGKSVTVLSGSTLVLVTGSQTGELAVPYCDAPGPGPGTGSPSPQTPEPPPDTETPPPATGRPSDGTGGEPAP